MSSILLLTCLTVLIAPVIGAYSGKVLLVSMDGFRWDYLDQVDTPNFDDFAKHGVKLPYVNNSFVTKTFPNHYTIVTGLHEESHGITENHMYDPVFNATFSMRTKEPRWWNGGEPVWVTAKKQGLKTGTFYWPGSEVEIRGFRPDYWFNYSDTTNYTLRVDTVVDWFKNQGVSMATLYYPEPDHYGHVYGPDTPEVKGQVKRMDGILGYLMQEMKSHGLLDEVNVIVTSDHGMTTIDNVNRVVDISDHVDMTKVQRVPSSGPVAHIQPVEGSDDDIFTNLTAIPHTTVYRKEDIPDHFHYRNNRRIMPIVMIADEGWMITTNRARQAMDPDKGTHGFDNRLQSMKPIFLARGPDFKTNFTSDPIQNVDIYPLMCQLLNIKSSENNGSLARVSPLVNVAFTTPSTGSPLSSTTPSSSNSLKCTILAIVFFVCLGVRFNS